MGRRVERVEEPEHNRIHTGADITRRVISWRLAVFGGMGQEHDQLTEHFELPKNPTTEDYEEVIRRRGLWSRYMALLGREAD